MQEVEAELGKAQNGYNQLLSISSDFSILAPESGMLIYKRDWRGSRVTEGATINSWDPVVATLPDLSVMESKTFVNEVDIQKIKVGQHVEISLDADADKKLTGRVTSIANIGEQRPNSDAKVFDVGIVVNEPDSTLRPAMTTSNTIIVASVPEALSVPLETIQTSDSLNFVYVKDGLKVVRQEIRIGLINENEAVVEAGLTEDDRLYLSSPTLTEEPELRRLSGADALAEERPDLP
jgi:hypothetical protein